MYIEHVFPAVVAGKDTLWKRLLEEAAEQGIAEERAKMLVSEIPDPLAGAGAFLDKLTGLWRYEFGLPYDIADQLVWGTRMWVPVGNLYGAESVPDHDPALLFRSVEQKFVPADPDAKLQGVWVLTNIKQDEDRLLVAFADLDETKVHFAVLGDWKRDAYVIARRGQDRQYLMKLFQREPSMRFTFKKPNP